MAKVFISYSHDSDAHAARVRGLAASLSRDGCVCPLDVHKDTDEDWPLWMTRQLREADFILCTITETYQRRFEDQELPDQGHGVGWEAGLIRRMLYGKKLHNDRIFPIFFDPADQRHIPIELNGYEQFPLNGEASYETLLRKLLGKPRHIPTPTGAQPELMGHADAPLFGRPGSGTLPPPGACSNCPIDISLIDRYAPEALIGREAELAILDQAWEQVQAQQPQRPHLLTFVALGGEGKTSLVAHWAAQQAHRDWPGCEAAFAWSFYSQGTRDQSAASSDIFLKEALRFFGDPELAESPAGAWDKGKRLAQLVGGRRALLILDGLEPLQYAPTSPTPGELKDQGLTALLKGLAAASQGLCLVTTRYAIPDLKAYRRTTAPDCPLPRLSTPAGVDLLLRLGVKGVQKEFETLVEEVKGHALTLQLIGSWLCDAHGGDIRQKDRVRLAEADAEEQGGHAFRVMDAYVQSLQTGGKTLEDQAKGQRALALLRLLGLFDRPADLGCLEALWGGDAIPGLTEPLMDLAQVCPPHPGFTPDAEHNQLISRYGTSKIRNVVPY